MKKFLLLILICLLFANVGLFAVPAIPTPIEVTQPDGTTLTIRLNGDEKFHYTTTEDGYMITQNQQNFYVYATVSQAGELQPTARIARNENARNSDDFAFLRTLNTSDDILRLQNAANTANIMQGTPPALVPSLTSPPQQAFVGSMHLLVILVNFTDVTYQYPQSNFVNMTNLPGYNYNGASGSVSDYFVTSSYGKFNPTFDVVGPYTLSHPESYYGRYYGTASPPSGYSNGPGMIIDACTAAHNAGINFAQYDTDNNGKVDNVMVIFAGYNQAEGAPNTTVWPHRWAIQPGYNVTTGTNITFDGKTLYDYSCASELKGSSGNTMCGIGTFCHEFSHVVGLMDYYNTSAGTAMLGSWSTMASGNYNNNSNTPPAFSAYDRFEVGWLTPEQYTSTSGYKTLYPMLSSPTPPANTNGQAYLVSATASNMNGASPSPSEFFMIEYRTKTGFDASLPAAGMLIWHIDYVASIWNNNQVNVAGTSQTQASHMHVYIQPTNGLTNTTTGDPFPTATVTSFTPKLWNGTSLSTSITNITKVGTSYITFGVPTAPSNDNCSGAIDIACETPIQGIITSATPTTSITYSTDPSKNDVFYSFTANSSGTHTITLTNFTDNKDIFLYSNCSSTTDLAHSNTTSSTETMSYNCTAGTTYYIRVTDFTGTGGVFTISLSCPYPPACATLTAPANAATNVLPTGTNLTWNAVTGVTGYKIYFGTSSSLTTPITTQTATTYPTGTLSPNTTYYWKIIPYNDAGEASGCEVRSFTTMALPACATLTAPENDQTDVTPIGINLTWNAVAGVTGYKVYCDVNPAPTTLVSTQTGLSYFMSGLTANTTYYWKVIPYNDAGDASGCEVRSFTTMAIPQCATITFPENGVTGIALTGINLTWNTVAGATGYKIFFDMNSSPTTLVSTQPTTTYNTGPLIANTTYYWKIVSYNAAGNATECEVRSFTTLAPPVCAMLTAPENNQTNVNPTGIDLTWNMVTGAAGYKVYFGTTPSPTTLVSTQAGTNYSTGELIANTTYYWKIVPYNDAGDATGCEIRSFTTLAPPPIVVLTEPADEETDISPSGILLTWNPVEFFAYFKTSTSGYKVYFDTNPSPATLVSIQTETSYFTGPLSPNTTYYWKVVPFNEAGDATGSDVRTFGTICQTYNTPEEVTVCSGGSYTCPDGTVLTNLTTAISHTNNLLSVYNCDSVVVSNIDIISANLTITVADNALTADQSGAEYQWYKGCADNLPMTAIEGATEQSYTADESGYYSVEISYEGCSFYSECIYLTVTGNDVVTNNDIILYPNPATNELFVIVNSHTTIHKAQIVDITGKTIAECQLLSDNSIDVSALSQGVYFIKIETDKGFIVDKFIKK
ncbi:MAG: M6 family metalloprotease domain-containing protein [Paludibacter sp.]|nr:M6 family metalloprotease domain-containing protein [Paludibacter sp.]